MIRKLKKWLVQIGEAIMAMFLIISPFIVLNQWENSFTYYLGTFAILCADFYLFDVIFYNSENKNTEFIYIEKNDKKVKEVQKNNEAFYKTLISILIIFIIILLFLLFSNII